MNSLRFNPYKICGYPQRVHHNFQFFGFLNLIRTVTNNISPNSTMIEIGSFMGESTMMFASTCYFDKIYSIDPYDGDDMGIKDLGLNNWNFIQEQFKINTRYFDYIEQINDYSQNVYNQFKDNSIDFIYIDADHTYESVKRDIELFIPKLKNGGIIGGHDYSNSWPGVKQAVTETIGKPTWYFKDTSWLHRIEK